MKPLVTVVVAAYNVEKFLNTGIQYILQQTYQNIEIILVDDGSTDSTPQLCDELAKKDARIQVFHKKNGGVGSARNVGIEYARGEYLYFFDVDDALELNFIEDSVRYAQEKQVDLIIYGYYTQNRISSEKEKISIKEREIFNNDELKQAYCEELLWLKHGNGFAWNKFYRLSFIKKHNFHFGNQKVQQDEIFNMQLYPKLERVYVCPQMYYHYVIYANGNAGSRYIDNKEEIITDVYHKFMDFYLGWKLKEIDVLKYIQNRYVRGIFGVVTGNYFHEDCVYTKQQRKIKISNVMKDSELRRVIENCKLQYGGNILNNIQIFAFNNGYTRILIWATVLKAYLKKNIYRR